MDMKWPPALTLTRLRERPDQKKLDQEGFKPGSFQALPALISYYDIPHYWVWRCVFERDGHWFEYRLQMNSYIEITQSDWWDYLNSFKCTIPATGPSTAPTTHE